MEINVYPDMIYIKQGDVYYGYKSLNELLKDPRLQEQDNEIKAELMTKRLSWYLTNLDPWPS